MKKSKQQSKGTSFSSQKGMRFLSDDKFGKRIDNYITISVGNMVKLLG
jgi:hypothetical protein